MIDPAWVALSLTKHLGGKTFRALLNDFDHNLNAILSADSARLRKVPGVGAKIAQAICEVDLDTVQRAIERWQQAGVQIISLDNLLYPAPLRALEDSPPTLFVRGTLPDFKQRRAFALVGTRQPSPQSRELTTQLSMSLVEQGYMVVSGLAEGVDAAAHIGALAVPGGITLAVLGSGVLNLYPPSNAGLAQAIIQRGAVLCEVAPETTVSAPGLVARNRIITGLCEGVIVVETSLEGGAMHAVRFAKVQGKTLYAVENHATGNRHLLDEGATAIQSARFQF